MERYNNTTSIVLFKSDKQREVDEKGKKAADFGTNDYTEEELNELHFLMSTQTNWAKTNPEYLFNSFKGFAKLSSTGDLQKVALDMIDHFKNGNSKDYANEILTKETKNHESTKEFVYWVQSSVHRHLKNNNGNINELKYYEGSKDVKGTVQKSIMLGTLPAFATWKDNFGGLGICVHDVWATNIEIVDYTFDGKYKPFVDIMEFEVDFRGSV